MAPKKKSRTNQASSSQPPSQPPAEIEEEPPSDPSRFQTRKAELRYERYLKTSPVVDKGINFAEIEEMTELDSVREKIVQRGWLNFVEQPEEGNLTMVREFMAHCSKDSDESVFCRGVEVKFDTHIIDDIYQTPDLGQVDARDKDFITPAMMSKVVCLPNFHYNPLGEVKQITSPVLTFESKVWFYFIISRIMPTKNGRELTRERLWLLYCLATGRQIDVARIIKKQIQDASEITKYMPIYFPNLISTMCKRAGVPERDGDVTCPSSRPMGKAYYRKMLREMPLDGVILEEIRPQERPRTRTHREIAKQQIRNDVELGRYLEQTRNEMVTGLEHLARQLRVEPPQFPDHIPLRNMNPFGEALEEEEGDSDNEVENEGMHDEEEMDGDD